MKQRIDLSVILIVRNNWEQIERCLKSVLKQPGLELELILLNDGSDDGASAPIKKFADSYESINLFEQKFKGIVQSRNKAIRQIKGKYTLFIEQEQELLPYSLQIAFREAVKRNVDILQMPYIRVEEKNGKKKETTVNVLSLKEPVTGLQYARLTAAKGMFPTDSYVNLINSEYLSDKVMRFDYRLEDEYDFDFFAKAVIGAGSVFTTHTPVCMSVPRDLSDIAADESSVKLFNQSREYIRKNFNEYAEANYFSNEAVEMLRYVRHMNLLKYGVDNLQKALPEEDFMKWTKYMVEHMYDYSGWKNISRIRLRRTLKKYLTSVSGEANK